jgi:hypothetical protein
LLLLLLLSLLFATNTCRPGVQASDLLQLLRQVGLGDLAIRAYKTAVAAASATTAATASAALKLPLPYYETSEQLEQDPTALAVAMDE